MSNIVTSKEAILEAGRNLIRKQGFTDISIRAVASECGVSIGSIYNYFESKSDLVAAAVESVWSDIFHIPERENYFTDFPDCIEWIYESMKKGEQHYPGFFTLHSMSFLGEEKAKGKQLMKQSLEHIHISLCTILKYDKNVRPDAFNEIFTCEKFVELIFSLIFGSLLRQDYNSMAVLEVIRRSVY